MTIVRLLPLLSAAVFSLPAAHASETLPPLGADLQQTSVSGLSSGGYMAGQFHAAHSKYVKGAAIVGAGPYACARSGVANSVPFFAIALAANFTQAETACMKTTLADFADILDGKRLASFAGDLASKGDIDPLDGLSRSKVYLYSGKDDIIVDTKVVATARDFYARPAFHRNRSSSSQIKKAATLSLAIQRATLAPPKIALHRPMPLRSGGRHFEPHLWRLVSQRQGGRGQLRLLRSKPLRE